MSFEIAISQAPWGSCDYRAAVALRRNVLRLPLGLDFTEEDLSEEKDQVHLVAASKGEIVGCLCLVKLNHGMIKMRQVAVTPELQRSGVGRKLVELSEKWALEHGFNAMVLHARETVTGFYENLGYQPVGDLFEEVGIPHRKMIKRLGTY